MSLPHSLPYSLGGGDDDFIEVDLPEGATTFDDGTIRYVDHVANAVGRLIDRFKRPRIMALLETWMYPIQELERALWQVKLFSGVDTAFSEGLDHIGALVGEGRGGRSDAEYVLAIKARAAINRSNGRRAETLSILGLVLGQDYRVRVKDYYPASQTYEFCGLTGDARYLRNLLARTTGGGVRAQVIHSTTARTAVFVPGSAHATVGGSGNLPGTVYDGTHGGLSASVLG